MGSRLPSTSSSSPGELVRTGNGLKKTCYFIQLFCCFQPTLRPGYPFWHLQVLRRTSQSNILSPKINIHFQDQSLSGTVENFSLLRCKLSLDTTAITTPLKLRDLNVRLEDILPERYNHVVKSQLCAYFPLLSKPSKSLSSDWI